MLTMRPHGIPAGHSSIGKPTGRGGCARHQGRSGRAARNAIGDRMRWNHLGAALLIMAPAGALAHAPKGSIVIPSGDVEALYAAVGDPAHADTPIVLEPGTYVLSAVDPGQK